MRTTLVSLVLAAIGIFLLSGCERNIITGAVTPTSAVTPDERTLSRLQGVETAKALISQKSGQFKCSPQETSVHTTDAFKVAKSKDDFFAGYKEECERMVASKTERDMVTELYKTVRTDQDRIAKLEGQTTIVVAQRSPKAAAAAGSTAPKKTVREKTPITYEGPICPCR